MKELDKEVLTVSDIAYTMDPSALAINASYEDLYEMIGACKKYEFGSSFTWPAYYPVFSAELKKTKTAFGASLAFPSGQEPTFLKEKQAEWFMTMDPVEVDMVMNVGWLRSKKFKETEDDIKAVRKVIGDTSLKVIIEAMQLTDEEIISACKVCIDAGADYVKTGTGFSKDPTTLHHVELIKATVGTQAKLKVAGGVRDLKTLLQMYKRGARRFGIGYRNAVNIIKEAQNLPGGQVDTNKADELELQKTQPADTGY
ncbi:MAG TPA: deoxyribose-phosphate aldolase [Clostridiales bacterium]|nr:deoxyribose-phosphate aldolase [Clostridiales bacterium]